jgi:hypothetical protein
MDMKQPTVEWHGDGTFTMKAEFRWRQDCGERKVPCWLKDRDRHGGPDVFGVFLGEPVSLRSSKLTLVSNCGRRRVEQNGQRQDDGAVFLVPSR